MQGCHSGPAALLSWSGISCHELQTLLVCFMHHRQCWKDSVCVEWTNPCYFSIQLNAQPERRIFWTTATPLTAELIMRCLWLHWDTLTTSWSIWFLQAGRNENAVNLWWGNSKSVAESLRRISGFLDCTDWDVFRTAANSLYEYTEFVTSYIGFPEDSCVPTSPRVSYINDKPFFTAKLLFTFSLSFSLFHPLL